MATGRGQRPSDQRSSDQTNPDDTEGVQDVSAADAGAANDSPEAQEARMAANQADTEASEKAVDDAQSSDDNQGKLVVLVGNFVARDDADDKSSTHQYRRGEQFHPLDKVHNVDALIRSRVIGRVGGDKKLTPTTALMAAQAAAAINQEDSPVIDLESQPFEQVQARDALPDDDEN